jgi:REP-associated tyrosine transposase
MNLEQSTKKYHSNHSIVYSCQYHVIFCPKYRRKVLHPPLDTRLKELILEKQEPYGYKILGMKVLPDHVHLLLDVNPQIGINTIVSQIKGYTAHSLRTEFPWLKKRLPSLWTRSKFISSVGAVTLEVVQRYIDSQKGK